MTRTPDSADIKLTPLVDTLMYIMRDGSAIDLSVEHPKAAARELLLSDNPYLHPSLVDAHVKASEEALNNE